MLWLEEIKRRNKARMDAVKEGVTTDRYGVPYAKLSDLKHGSEIMIGEGFSCVKPGKQSVHRKKKKQRMPLLSL